MTDILGQVSTEKCRLSHFLQATWRDDTKGSALKIRTVSSRSGIEQTPFMEGVDTFRQKTPCTTVSM